MLFIVLVDAAVVDVIVVVVVAAAADGTNGLGGAVWDCAGA